MVTIIRNPIDEYRIAYEKTKWKLEIAEAFNERYEKKIKRLEEENKAYRILLKDKLEKEMANNG